MDGHARWTIESLTTLWVFGIISALCLLAVLGYAVYAFWTRDEEVRRYRWWVAASSVGALVVALVVIWIPVGWGMWPWKAEYHQWRPTAGIVAASEARMIAGDHGGTTQMYSIQYTDGRQRKCEDTRCAGVRVGDWLSLNCVKRWQWSGEHGFDCTFDYIR